MIKSSKLFAVIATIVAVTFVAEARAQQDTASYPVTLGADDVHELTDLTIASNGLELTSDRLTAIPIRCEVGITGAMLLGNGEFRFKPEDAKEISGEFRGAMLRFHPENQNELIKFDDQAAKTDLAAREMCQHLLNNVFGHCWHRGREALIPDAGSFVANVYSKEHGDLLISTGPTSTAVYNFTERKMLYQSK